MHQQHLTLQFLLYLSFSPFFLKCARTAKTHTYKKKKPMMIDQEYVFNHLPISLEQKQKLLDLLMHKTTEEKYFNELGKEKSHPCTKIEKPDEPDQHHHEVSQLAQRHLSPQVTCDPPLSETTRGLEFEQHETLD